MKKQLLILILAIFAIGFSSTAFGQLVPRELECIDLDDPLNVVPGHEYTYEVNVPTPPGTKTFHWFVTQDVNMIANSVLIPTMNVQAIGGAILAAGDVHYNAATAGANTINLTFQSFTLAADQYVFLGILVENTDNTGAGCTTNNFKVYRIRPMHAFSLDLANVLDDGTILQNLVDYDYGDNIDHCIADILTATYNPVADAITYDFSENTFYYAVAAANFSGSYELSVRLTGLQGGATGQTATITWGYTWATVAANVLAPAGSVDGTFTVTINQQAATGAVGADGETIYIRVVVDHGTQYEANVAANIPYELAVNGNLLDSGGNLVANGADVHHVGSTCAQVAFDDIAIQSLIPRPTITSVNPVPQGYLDID